MTATSANLHDFIILSLLQSLLNCHEDTIMSLVIPLFGIQCRTNKNNLKCNKAAKCVFLENRMQYLH